MEVSHDLGQTEIGFLPNDWEVWPLNRISPQQSVGLVINPSSYYAPNGTVPLLVGSNIRENSIDWESASRISAASNDQLPASRLAAGDLVTVRVGAPGVTAVVPDVLDGCNCASMMIIRQHPSFDSRWLSYVMNSHFGRSQVEGVQYGTAQKQFNISDAIHFKLPHPPKVEQEAIAEALLDADALIDSLIALVVKKRNIKQGAMQELLTCKKRLLGFSNEWQEMRLEEIAEIRSGGTPSTTQSQFWGGTIPWCTPTDITGLNGFKYLTTTSRTITLAGLQASSAELIPQNSVIMTTRATIGECAINTVPVTTNQGFKNFIPLANTSCEFLYYLLAAHKQGFIRLCSGSTFPEIGKTQLQKYMLKLPDNKDEQSAIAEILSNMDAEIAALETKLAKARLIKQGMMQELLTGRIRLV